MRLQHLIGISVVELLRKSEISQFNFARLDVFGITEQNIGEFQISVHYFYISESTERLGQLVHHILRVFLEQLVGLLLHIFMKVPARTVLKDEVGVIFGSEDIVKVYNVLTTSHFLKNFNFFLQRTMQVISEFIIGHHFDGDLFFIATINP